MSWFKTPNGNGMVEPFRSRKRRFDTQADISPEWSVLIIINSAQRLLIMCCYRLLIGNKHLCMCLARLRFLRGFVSPQSARYSHYHLWNAHTPTTCPVSLLSIPCEFADRHSQIKCPIIINIQTWTRPEITNALLCGVFFPSREMLIGLRCLYD